MHIDSSASKPFKPVENEGIPVEAPSHDKKIDSSAAILSQTTKAEASAHVVDDGEAFLQALNELESELNKIQQELDTSSKARTESKEASTQPSGLAALDEAVSKLEYDITSHHFFEEHKETTSASLSSRIRSAVASTGIAGGSPSVPSSLQTDRSLAWKFYKNVLRYSPKFFSKFVSPYVVREGRVHIKEIAPSLIPKLSKTLMADLDLSQVNRMQKHDVEKLSIGQVFAIAPQRTAEIDPKIMAWMVNALDADAADNMLDVIMKQNAAHPTYLGEFYKSLDIDKMNLFISKLIQPSQKPLNNVFQELMDPKSSNAKKAPSTPTFQLNAQGRDIEVHPYEQFAKDAHRSTFTINGNTLSKPNEQELFTELYHATGDDLDLTEKLSLILNQSVTRDMALDATLAYSVEAFPGIPIEEAPRVAVMDTIYDVKFLPKDVIEIRVSNPSAIKIGPDPSRGSAPIIGYSSQQTVIRIKKEDLKNGNFEKARIDMVRSPMLKTYAEALSYEPERGARLPDLNAPYPERTVGGGSKAVDVDLRARKQVDHMAEYREKSQVLHTSYNDADAIDVAFLKFRNVPDIVAMTNKVGVRIDKGQSLEEMRQEFKDNYEIQEFLDDLEARLADPEKSLKDVFKDAQSHLLGLYRIAQGRSDRQEPPYGFTPMASDMAWKSDVALVHTMILEELEPFEGRALTATEKAEVRQAVTDRLDSLHAESKQNVQETTKYYSQNEASIQEFKDDLKGAILASFKEGSPVLLEEKKAELRKKYGSVVETEDVNMGEVFEFAMEQASAEYLKLIASIVGDDINGAYRKLDRMPAASEKESVVDDVGYYVNKATNDALNTFFEIKVNLPEESKTYAARVLDEVLDHPGRH